MEVALSAYLIFISLRFIASLQEGRLDRGVFGDGRAGIEATSLTCGRFRTCNRLLFRCIAA
jgi:hypothetical protein